MGLLLEVQDVDSCPHPIGGLGLKEAVRSAYGF